MITIYTDGACSGNPGKGGWGVVILDKDNDPIFLNGGIDNTTNNRMELTAAINALSYFQETKEIKLKTKIQKITKEELISADEVFLSGTAAEITPIVKIERKKIGSGKPGMTTKMIMQTYSDIVMNKNKKFTKWLTAVY